MVVRRMLLARIPRGDACRRGRLPAVRFARGEHWALEARWNTVLEYFAAAEAKADVLRENPRGDNYASTSCFASQRWHTYRQESLACGSRSRYHESV